jgi:hypothetical protein
MARTIQQVQSELDTVNAAIQELISGNRITQLRIGSGDFARLYHYQEITIENLQDIRANLLQELAVLSQDSEIKFRTSCNFPFQIAKFRR